MKRRSFVAGGAAALSISPIMPALANPSQSANPLLNSWSTPWGAPPFAAIKSRHFMPAINAAIAAHKREITDIAANTAPPSFENVVEALERAGQTLSRVTSVFYSLSAMLSTPTMRRLEGPISEKLSAHASAISQNGALFARIKALFDGRQSLNLKPEQTRLLELTHAGFVRDGALLDQKNKALIAQIDARLSALQVQFGQNVLADQSAFALALTSPADLEGLSADFIASAKQAAVERKIEALGIVTLSRSSFEPFLTMSKRQDLREKVQKGWMAVCGRPGPHDNRPLVREILDLRTQRAQLLGFTSFAHFQLDNKMAKSPQAALDMMMGVWRTSIASAGRERDKLQALASTEGLTGDLKSWDWWHYGEKVRKADYDVNEDETRPYFELNNMIAAMQWHAGQLFGISFAKVTNVPIWHQDVVAYEVRDRDDVPIALWYGDFFARQSKQSGAWMSSFRDQQFLRGDIKPIVYNVCNYARAPQGQPNLLSLDDVITLFHEFGHALHGMLSQVTYPSMSGTNVLRDFVEFPSQLMEHWVTTPEILSRFAKHHATGEIIPQALVDKIIAARSFNQGWATSEFLLAAIMDMKMHMIEGPAPADIDAWEREILDGLGSLPEIVVRYRPGYFKHTFEGGYAAGYYSYIWAAVLECDAFQAFVESGRIYDATLSAKLKEYIFASGGEADPMDNSIKFRGRAPGVEALLADRGLHL